MSPPFPGLTAALYGALAASALGVGALLAIWRKPASRTIGLVMGFGSGALISSIADELVPESLVDGTSGLALAFAVGANTFLGLAAGLISRWTYETVAIVGSLVLPHAGSELCGR